MLTHARELIVGAATGVGFLAMAATFGATSGVPGLREYSVLFGIGGGGACGVFAALATHLARDPRAHYEPIDDDAGAWGMMEYDERTKLPP